MNVAVQPKLHEHVSKSATATGRRHKKFDNQQNLEVNASMASSRKGIYTSFGTHRVNGRAQYFSVARSDVLFRVRGGVVRVIRQRVALKKEGK